jgi:hypothetical protein
MFAIGHLDSSQSRTAHDRQVIVFSNSIDPLPLVPARGAQRYVRKSPFHVT